MALLRDFLSNQVIVGLVAVIKYKVLFLLRRKKVKSEGAVDFTPFPRFSELDKWHAQSGKRG